MHYYQLKTPEDILNTAQNFQARFAEEVINYSQESDHERDDTANQEANQIPMT
jgi:hypothetical protein